MKFFIIAALATLVLIVNCHGDKNAVDPNDPDDFHGVKFKNRCVGCITYKSVYCYDSSDPKMVNGSCVPSQEECYNEENVS